MAAVSRGRADRLAPVIAGGGLACLALAFAHGVRAESPGAQPARALDFARDVLPILSDRCFLCHGPDPTTRKAGLRLDGEADSRKDLGGYRAIEPGKPEASEALKRMLATDPDDLMPPPKLGKPLTPEQIAIVRRWIAEGAKYRPHWAFVPPEAPTPPAGAAWVRNPIDAFIAKRLRDEGLAPAPEAPRETLIRRVTLALTGLPPTPAEVDAFLADRRPDAYERVVDGLLASLRYGEHQARLWLDVARYGDTHGLHHDNRRSMWPYRDFVVRAFATNLPFDRFTTWQLAGDLLPEPTRDQLIATGFLRAHVTTHEQGTIEAEAKAAIVRDRVETFGQAYLGLTVGCAACHDHKYDPFSTRDFYALGAFFDNGQDAPMDGNIDAPPPFLRLTTPDQERALAALDGQLGEIDRRVRTALAAVAYRDPMTAAAVETLARREHLWRGGTLAGAQATPRDGRYTLVDAKTRANGRPSGVIVDVAAAGKVSFLDPKALLEIGQGDVLLVDAFVDPRRPPTAIMVEWKVEAKHGTWNHRAFWGDAAPSEVDAGDPIGDDAANYARQGALPPRGRWVTLAMQPPALNLGVGAKVSGVAFAQKGGRVHWDRVRLRTLTPQEGAGFDSLALWATLQHRKTRDNIGLSLPAEVKQALQKAPDKRSLGDARAIEDYFLEQIWNGGKATFEPLHQERERVAKARQDLLDTIPHTLIYREAPERAAPSHVLVRGEYDKLGEVVEPAAPAVLPALPDKAPTDRLALARWLLDPRHPLMARVTVNRFWQQHFGTGLVKTSWDFGLQGDWPSHPELLDWLATRFVASGWDVKALHRLIVTSATYRQSSWVSKDKLEKDPENRLLARGPRFRVDGEVLRDQALFVSGLLDETLGGPGVKPYQPPGLWEEISLPSEISNTRFFVADQGSKLYRRSLYTFWKRLAPHPAMTAFDAPSREICVAKRERTNTPLQALVLMNDPQFVEASRKLAERALRRGGDDGERIAWAFRQVTARTPTGGEIAVLRRLLDARLGDYRARQDAAAALLKVGDAPADPALDPAALAAWTMVANALLNTDEAVTQE